MKQCVLLVRNDPGDYGESLMTYYLPGEHPYTGVVLSGGSRSPYTRGAWEPCRGSYGLDNGVVYQDHPVLLSRDELLEKICADQCQYQPCSKSEETRWNRVQLIQFPNYGPITEEHEQLYKSITAWLDSLKPLHYCALTNPMQLLGTVYLEDGNGSRTGPSPNSSRGFHLRGIEISLYNKVLSCTQREVENITAAAKQLHCNGVAKLVRSEMQSRVAQQLSQCADKDGTM